MWVLVYLKSWGAPCTINVGLPEYIEIQQTGTQCFLSLEIYSYLLVVRITIYEKQNTHSP